MTSEPLPKAAQAEHLTEALYRCGALIDGRVSGVVVESSRATLLSRIIRLRLSYDSRAADAPASIILKTGLPERANARWKGGPNEVAFYTRIAAAMAGRVVPRCFEADCDAETNQWHLLLEDLTESHFTLGNWPMPPTLVQTEQIVAAICPRQENIPDMRVALNDRQIAMRVIAQIQAGPDVDQPLV